MTKSREELRATGKSGRLIARNGRVTLEWLENNQGAELPVASIVSRGTERRTIAAMRTGVELGYMNVFRGASALSIFPTPHGSPMQDLPARGLHAPVSTSLELLACARFQMMTALHVANLLRKRDVKSLRFAVVGSGAVGCGAVHELFRQGAESVALLVRNTREQLIPKVDLQPVETDNQFDVVVDAVGMPGEFVGRVADGGVLGILGTPDAEGKTRSGDLLDVHRRGITVIGMHELVNYDHNVYQSTFADTCLWAAEWAPVHYWSSLVERISPDEYADFIYADHVGRRSAQVGLITW